MGELSDETTASALADAAKRALEVLQTLPLLCPATEGGIAPRGDSQNVGPAESELVRLLVAAAGQLSRSEVAVAAVHICAGAGRHHSGSELLADAIWCVQCPCDDVLEQTLTGII